MLVAFREVEVLAVYTVHSRFLAIIKARLAWHTWRDVFGMNDYFHSLAEKRTLG